MLFRRDVLDAIAAGRVTLAFRRSDRPRAVPGARHRTPIGLLEVVAVEEVAMESITEDDARAARRRPRRPVSITRNLRGFTEYTRFDRERARGELRE